MIGGDTTEPAINRILEAKILAGAYEPEDDLYGLNSTFSVGDLIPHGLHSKTQYESVKAAFSQPPPMELVLVHYHFSDEDISSRLTDSDSFFKSFEEPGDAAFPTLEAIAEQLHTSSRTLIRRLRAMNTTYQAITEDVRKLRARELLANEANRLQDVAKHLGYEDLSNFRRAFKRWYGMTPKAYREEILNRV